MGRVRAVQCTKRQSDYSLFRPEQAEVEPLRTCVPSQSQPKMTGAAAAGAAAAGSGALSTVAWTGIGDGGRALPAVIGVMGSASSGQRASGRPGKSWSFLSIGRCAPGQQPGNPPSVQQAGLIPAPTLRRSN